jgi:hypothetical protein
VTLLKEARKKGVVGRGKTRLRRVQRREVNLGGFKEDSKTKRSGYKKWQRKFGYKLINEASPPCLVSCKPLPRSCRKRRVTSVPTVAE